MCCPDGFAYIRMQNNKAVAVEDLQETIALLPDTTFIHKGRTSTATDEHVAIIEAIRNHDPDAAERAAIQHIKAALEVRLVITKTEE